MNQQADEHLARVMRIDPLDVAENITNQRVEDGGIGFAAGLYMVQSKAATMKRLLRERDDVWDGMPLADYRRVVEQYGFELLLVDEFKGWDRTEQFFVYGHPDGMLLKFDTFRGDRVNGGNVYYNWRPHGEIEWDVTSSGGLVEPDYTVWAGHHDCCRAMIFNLERLRSKGNFVSPWVGRPFLWLLHYEEPKVDGYDHMAITAARIARLPQWARDFMGPA